jgi:ribonuclease D
MPQPRLTTTASDLEQVLDAARTAPLLALDVEGNGLFAYRARLCTVQLAWTAAESIEVAIIDTLAVDPSPLAGLLGESGPTKVLHDLSFDARLLLEAGVRLGNVRDTSVTARMLGRRATGLAALLAIELQIDISKSMQQHDWSRRPLGPREIAYLSTDVIHLAKLDEKLRAEAGRLDIEQEVDDECRSKLASALGPAAPGRPPYLRIRGAEALDAAGLAVLRRLVELRERIACARDLPPFKIVSNEVLLEVARRRPTSVTDLAPLWKGPLPSTPGAAAGFVEAVTLGLADGKIPDADRELCGGLPSAHGTARRTKEKRLSAWRRAEAASRGVDEQVVLPGHCLKGLAAVEPITLTAVAEVPGIGSRRLFRYGATILALLRGEEVSVTSPDPNDVA